MSTKDLVRLSVAVAVAVGPGANVAVGLSHFVIGLFVQAFMGQG